MELLLFVTRYLLEFIAIQTRPTQPIARIEFLKIYRQRNNEIVLLFFSYINAMHEEQISNHQYQKYEINDHHIIMQLSLSPHFLKYKKMNK